VAERLADKISIIDTERLEVVDAIDLGGPQTETLARRGQRLFHSASHTFQGQFSCRSCHPDGGTDALSYDLEPDGLGLNIVNNPSLRGRANTAPYKWTGKNASLYRQCGFRFAKWLTRTGPYAQDELYSIVAYILSLSYPPNRYRDVSGELTSVQQRGETIFERAQTNDGRVIPAENRCITCHPPPRFTDRRTADVGTSGPSDTEKEFDTPQLDNLYASAPYLHDGRAATLEEIWTRFNPDDTHGVANDLTKIQLNDLIEYLKALGPSDNRE
jgi:cytochrome c peroxidase